MIIKEFKGKYTKDYKVKVGQENEKETAYYLDFEFKNSKNFMIIHDLNIEYNGRKAQIDHLVIGRMYIYVIESKFFSGEVSIEKNGDWTVQYKTKSISIPSPVEQNNRHISVLKDILENNDIYPTFLGMKKNPSIDNLVFVSNKTIIKGKIPKYVIKQDTFRKYIDNSTPNNPIIGIGNLTKLVSQETLEEVANKILSFDIAKKPSPKKTFKKKIAVEKKEEIVKDKVPAKIIKDKVPTKIIKDDLESNLKKIRKEFADKEKIKLWHVFSNAVLDDIIKIKPKNEEEFLKINGVGKVKFDKYGEAFLDKINEKPLGNLESRLKAIRKEFADKEKIKLWHVFSNAVLEDIVKIKPKNEEEFLKINGVGKVKFDKYGEAFLSEIKR